ncbi:uncharacterized protein LOC133189504 isoform X8 [Saccostrea echinata]|uniref:uncharacterized protein LOC133189504 isoform X8 n=1 Tax=Saccostrea echinata TaxID=191078 RepID=UPI002A831C1B|nr:uncharacterized protein LOC133189504 isoform X8 [Saccostrea echinata]
MSQNYHKVYMNHVHSSTLLAQLSTMLKSQTLCDAIIKTGPVSTRAHRVVLVAACPMLQTMENATSGSHLEVRLASDISQESVNTFLQYLYEGYMILTEENCNEVEKIARLLQVDSITKCCADFNKCINKSAGAQFKYSFQDQTDFKHMRVSDLFKKQERSAKRTNEIHRPTSPGVKRQRLHSSSPKIHDTSSMAESYGATSDPWDRVPRLGSGFQGPGVIDIREDGFELVQTEPPKKDSSGIQEPVKIQTSVSLSVSSQHNHSSDLRVVNVVGDAGPPVSERAGKSLQAAPPPGGSSRDPISFSPVAIQDSPSSSTSSVEVSRSMGHQEKVQQKKEVEKQTQAKIHIPDYSDSQYTSEVLNTSTGSRASEDLGASYRAPYPVAMTQIPRQPAPKPFASGSASQTVSMPVFPETISSPASQKSQGTVRERSESSERPSSSGRSVDTGQDKLDDQPDLSIVKIETATERDMSNLEMYMGDESFGSHGHQPVRGEEDDPGPDYSVEEPPGEWPREDMSNESSNVSGMDSSANWYLGQMKGKIQRIDHRVTHASSWTRKPADLPPRKLSVDPQLNLPPLSVIHNLEGQCELYTKEGKTHVRHTLKSMPARKVCAYCKITGERFANGNIKQTFYHCETCNVPLCRFQSRECFLSYHKLKYQGSSSSVD